MKHTTWKHTPPFDPMPVGPWLNEPDKEQWADEATGLACLVLRNHTGALCGYVGVPSTHPLYGQQYQLVDVSVHDGLSYSADCSPSFDEAHGICHVVEPDEDDDVWWFGFASGMGMHAISPYIEHHLDLLAETNADLAETRARMRAMESEHDWMRRYYVPYPFVREQVEQLAAQLDELSR